jgi:hypothetical protein
MPPLYADRGRDMAFIPGDAQFLGQIIAIMGCDVGEFRHTSYGSPHPHDAEIPADMDHRASWPTQGEVFGQIARVIVVCLGLGLLARVLVAFTGIH